MAIGVDSPAWTFGLNPKIPGPRVPGPGTYDVAGRLGVCSIGTRFTPVGAKPASPRTDGSRLVFNTEEEDKQKPGPGAYDVIDKRPRRWGGHPGGIKPQSPRFPESSHATDAGPGAYLPSDFASGGPAYSLPAKPAGAFDAPESPGPGQYIEVQLSATAADISTPEGFGKRDSPRFDVEAAHTPGPGEYRSARFQPQIGKNITFGSQFRPPGWSAKIKEITRFACELGDDNIGIGENTGKRRGNRFRSPLERHGRTTRVRRRPSSAPPSSLFRRACARGRRLENSGPCKSPRSIADVVKAAGRRRRAHAAAASAKRASGDGTGRGAVIGSAPQRPPDAKRTPSPSSYSPVTLDEAARSGKVVSIGGKSKRELFPPSPDTPGPEWYAPDVIQGPAIAQQSRPRRTRTSAATAVTTTTGTNDTPFPSSAKYKDRPGSTSNSGDGLARRASPASIFAPANDPSEVVAAAPVGTFGSAERFPRDHARRPGVGEYDLRAAERATCKSAAAVAPTLGHRPTGVPYDPALNRYLRTDDLGTPSVHDYRPESVKGGAGECGAGGRAVAPPAWTFGKKRRSPRPPDGPGPGRFRPTGNGGLHTGFAFGAGREVLSGFVTGVPWMEAEERAARGDGGGGDAKLYLPERNRVGARAFMRSRRLPRPRK